MVFNIYCYIKVTASFIKRQNEKGVLDLSASQQDKTEKPKGLPKNKCMKTEAVKPCNPGEKIKVLSEAQT